MPRAAAPATLHTLLLALLAALALSPTASGTSAQGSWDFSPREFEAIGENLTDRLDYLLSVRPPAVPAPEVPSTLLDSSDECMPAEEPVPEPKRPRTGEMATTFAITESQLELLAQRAASSAVEQVMQKVNEVAERVATRVAEACCARLETRLAKLEASASSSNANGWQIPSSGASTTASSAGERTHLDGPGPSCIEIKGFIKNWADSEASALLSAEARECLEALLSLLSESDKMGIDAPRTLQATSRRTFLNMLCIFLREPSRAVAWRVKGAVEMDIKGRGLTIYEQIPIVAIETSQQMRPLCKAAGRFYSLLETANINKEAIKIEYVAFKELAIRRLQGVPRPTMLARYSESEGWRLTEAEWSSLSSMTHADAVARLSGA